MPFSVSICIVNNRKSPGHGPVDPCLSRRASRPEDFLVFVYLLLSHVFVCLLLSHRSFTTTGQRLKKRKQFIERLKSEFRKRGHSPLQTVGVQETVLFVNHALARGTPAIFVIFVVSRGSSSKALVLLVIMQIRHFRHFRQKPPFSGGTKARFTKSTVFGTPKQLPVWPAAPRADVSAPIGGWAQLSMCDAGPVGMMIQPHLVPIVGVGRPNVGTRLRARALQTNLEDHNLLK